MLVNVYPTDSVILPVAVNRGDITLTNYGPVPIWLAFDSSSTVDVGPSVGPNGAQYVVSRPNCLSAIHARHGSVGPVQVEITVEPFDVEDLLESAGGGGLTQTATVTTDPDTFVVSHTFDLGGPCIYSWVATLLEFDPDGVTVGQDDGEFGVDIFETDISRDGVTWKTTGTNFWFHDIVDGIGVFEMDGVYFTPRYVRFNTVRIASGFSGDTYAGPNHPIATVQLDVSYN